MSRDGSRRGRRGEFTVASAKNVLLVYKSIHGTGVLPCCEEEHITLVVDAPPGWQSLKQAVIVWAAEEDVACHIAMLTLMAQNRYGNGFMHLLDQEHARIKNLEVPT